MTGADAAVGFDSGAGAGTSAPGDCMENPKFAFAFGWMIGPETCGETGLGASGPESAAFATANGFNGCDGWAKVALAGCCGAIGICAGACGETERSPPC